LECYIEAFVHLVTTYIPLQFWSNVQDSHDFLIMHESAREIRELKLKKSHVISTMVCFVTPRSSVCCYLCFATTYCLHPEGIILKCWPCCTPELPTWRISSQRNPGSLLGAVWGSRIRFSLSSFNCKRHLSWRLKGGGIGRSAPALLGYYLAK
jgi:hypothetical protein